jgi:fatty acid synthase subunit beta
MFIGGRRWIDQSYAGLLAAFMLRTEDRFGDEDSDAEAITSEKDCHSKPLAVLEAVLQEFTLAATTLLCCEDVDYFTQLCRRPGQKPVPFIPALDDHFETWFKKDSLWQSEDVEAVVDQDADRTLILHGPVAARHTCRVDEPVGEVLDGINRGVIDHLMTGIHGGDESSLPYEEVIGRFNLSPNGDIPPSLGSSPWKLALFGSRFVVRGRDMVENPVRKLVSTISTDMQVQADPNSITVFTEARKPLLQISKQGREIQVLVFTHVTRDNEPTSLVLTFEYRPETPYAPIWEVMQQRNERICAMYRQLWQGQKHPSESREGSFHVDAARVRAFNRAIGYKGHQGKVPMDFAIVVCWRPICSALLQDPIQGDVLNLVHLSNAYEVGGEHGRTGAQHLMIGDELATRAYISSITIEPSGKVVQVACEIRRAAPNSPVIMTVRSSFLFRGSYADFSCTFAREVEPQFELDISSETDIAILATKPWFRLDDGSQLDHLNLTDLTLEFHLQTSTKWQSKSTYSRLDTAGRVYIRSETGDLTPVGTVEHHEEACRDNAVLSYLRRWGRVVDAQKTHPLQVPGGPTHGSPPEHKFEVSIPSSNEAYSRASGDFNPIHTSPLFAGLVNLPGTITHGMYCSAAVRQVVEKNITGGNPDRIRSYKVSFVGMVLPNDVLDVSLTHSGMQAGLQVIDIVVCNKQTGAKVLTGSALVAQPSTTVVFTGQGSQEKGMGMHLYACSPVARSIWDRAEAYFESQFGVSILDVVRNNPKEIKVHFGGVRGRMLRQNYLAMSHYETVAAPSPTPEGPVSASTRLDRRPLFPTVTQATASYTHSSPSGLLFSTQFAQPALAIMELAAFKDMEARGVVDPDCHFAGHSLGEYAALVSTTGLMSFENLLYTVFCRGMTMQGAVERDEQGRSGYAMVAVDPSRVHKGKASNPSVPKSNNNTH